MSKYLVIQTAFIGDVILATPVLEQIKKHLPAAQIDILVRKGNEKLLENHPFVNRVIVWNKQENKYKELLRLIKAVRNERYYAVINIQRFGATGLLTSFSGAKLKLGFRKNPFSLFFTHRFKHEIDNGKHEVERNLSLLTPLFAPSNQPPVLYPSESDFRDVEAYKKHKYICIAPTSVWFTKQFPSDQWCDFINQLPEDLHVYLLGGPDDKAACEQIASASTHNKVENLAGKLSFLQTTALLKGARMNYVNDSAPMHMASAINAPTTAVYCSTIPAFGFGPLAETAHIVEASEDLDCRPCGLHGYKSCPKGHFKCAKQITSHQLLENLKDHA